MIFVAVCSSSKPRSYACFTSVDSVYQRFPNPCSYVRIEMFEVPVSAQQCIVDALKESQDVSQTVVLCHTPSELFADGKFSLGTHDLFDDFFGKDAVSLISIFPNMGIIKQALKDKKEYPFTVDCIVACHHSCDPLDVSIDVVGKLGLEFQYVSQVAFVTEMPNGTYRPHATTAYRIRIQNEVCSKTNITWRKQQEQFDEFLIPKYLASQENVRGIINDLDGPLKRHSSKGNSLFDFEGGKNYDSFSFKPGRSGIKPYREELERLKNVCREHCEELPSAIFQFKERINWRWLSQEGSVDMIVLFCRNLDHHKLLQVASFLTSCAISFHFCSVNTLVIDTAGIDSSIMVRLMHYAEVPIPTTLKQGAFGLSIKGNGTYPGDRNLLSFDLRIGRIGSLPSIPVQIRCSCVERMMSMPLNKSSIGRWIKSELSGFNITEVVCVDDEQVTDSFLQFRVPIEDEDNYPKNCCYKGKSFSVANALPYATPIGMRARPPHEQSVHEHWKKAARLAPQEKKSHANCIAKSENCPQFLQRVMKLRESSVQDKALSYSVYTEQTKMPWCFFTGCVDDHVAVDCFCQYGIRYLENKDDIQKHLSLLEDTISTQERIDSESFAIHIVQICCNGNDDQPLQMGLFYEGKYGWTISTAELVQCHAYTPCTLIMMTPPGCKLTDICTPSRHYTVRKLIVIPGRKKFKRDSRSDAESLPTQLSPNRTASLGSLSANESYSQERNGPIKPRSGDFFFARSRTSDEAWSVI